MGKMSDLLKVIGNTEIVVDRSFSTEAQKFFPTNNNTNSLRVGIGST